jgi:DNA-binding GntR family transcriptional regulator
MSPGVTFERVYLALKDELGSGRHGAGEHLEPSALSADLNASITPVRDALHRLVGEGLVEAPRGDGFRTPLLTEIGLRHLYRWNGTLLDLAARAPGAEATLPSEAGLLDRTETLFLAIARRPGNPEHAAAVARLSERLRPMRHIEADLLPDASAEIDELSALLLDDASGPLRRALAAYHRKRERLAAEIVEQLHRGG